MRTQPRVFISYRTKDCPTHAWQIYHRLMEAFAPEPVFIDKNSIPVGVDFQDHLGKAIRDCDAMLVIIGPNWLETGAGGQLRIQQEDDVVRFEIELALSLQRLVIPALVGGGGIPSSGQLPESLRPLVRRHAAAIDMERNFRLDMDRLVEQIRAAVVRLPPAVQAGIDAVDAAVRSLTANLTERDAARVLLAAIHHGVDIYNSGEHLGCALVYQRATRGLVASILRTRVVAPALVQFQQRGESALARFEPLRGDNANAAAWEFRHNFDEFVDGLSSAVAQPPDPVIPDKALRAVLNEKVAEAGEEIHQILRQPSGGLSPAAIQQALLVSIRYGNALFGIKDFESCDRLHTQTARQILEACSQKSTPPAALALIEPLAQALESLESTNTPVERAWKLYEVFGQILEQPG